MIIYLFTYIVFDLFNSIYTLKKNYLSLNFINYINTLKKLAYIIFYINNKKSDVSLSVSNISVKVKECILSVFQFF